jgi:hypothetical protein
VQGRFNVPITTAGRSLLTLRFPYSAQRSVASRQLFRDQAVTNAKQLADLLTSADAAVVGPSG